MKWSLYLAGSLEVVIESFGALNCFLEKGIAETVGLDVISISYILILALYLCSTNCWAAAARLQNARVTSSELHDFDAIFSRIVVAVLSVISSSFAENQPDSFGHVVTSSWDSGGSLSFGMR